MSGDLDDMLDFVKKPAPPPIKIGRDFGEYQQEQEKKTKEKVDKEAIIPKVNYLEDE